MSEYPSTLIKTLSNQILSSLLLSSIILSFNYVQTSTTKIFNYSYYFLLYFSFTIFTISTVSFMVNLYMYYLYYQFQFLISFIIYSTLTSTILTISSTTIQSTTTLNYLSTKYLPTIYLLPNIGITIAEVLRNIGIDTLICFDDLSKHSKAYRQISLLSTNKLITLKKYIKYYSNVKIFNLFIVFNTWYIIIWNIYNRTECKIKTLGVLFITLSSYYQYYYFRYNFINTTFISSYNYQLYSILLLYFINCLIRYYHINFMFIVRFAIIFLLNRIHFTNLTMCCQIGRQEF